MLWLSLTQLLARAAGDTLLREDTAAAAAAARPAGADRLAQVIGAFVASLATFGRRQRDA